MIKVLIPTLNSPISQIKLNDLNPALILVTVISGKLTIVSAWVMSQSLRKTTQRFVPTQ